MEIKDIVEDAYHPTVEVSNPSWDYLVDKPHQPSKEFLALPNDTFL